MRAQTIYETIGFKRGRDPKHALDIGLFDENGQKKTEEEIHNENLLSHAVNWTSKESEARYIKDTVVTSNIENLLEIANIFTIPYEEFFIPDNNILSVILPPKYTHNIFMIFGEEEEENLYLIDPQGYDYARYITHLVPQSGINENINFKRGIDSRHALDVGVESLLKKLDSNTLGGLAFYLDNDIDKLTDYINLDDNTLTEDEISYIIKVAPLAEGIIHFGNYQYSDRTGRGKNKELHLPENKNKYVYWTSSDEAPIGFTIAYSDIELPLADKLLPSDY